MPETAPEAPPPALYTFERRGRNRATLLVLLLVWAALAAAWVWLEAAGWLLALFALATLPALWELVANPAAGLRLSGQELEWFTGRRDAQVALAQIHHVRLDTRLDLSVRATVVLRSGRRIRLPFEATPPHRAFEAALTDRGVAVERHHFMLVG